MKSLSQKYDDAQDSFADDTHAMLIAMGMKERRLYLFRDYLCQDESDKEVDEDFRDGKISSSWRTGLCEWIRKCAVHFSRGSDDLACAMEGLSVSNLDRFLATLPSRSRLDEQTVLLSGLASVHLSHSLLCGASFYTTDRTGNGGDERLLSRPRMATTLTFERLLQLVENTSLQTSDLRKAQRLMLRNLRFALHPPLAQEYLFCYKILLERFAFELPNGAVASVAPANVDQLLCQVHMLVACYMRSSFQLSSRPQYIVALCALATLMEYTFHLHDSGSAEVCRNFLLEIGIATDVEMPLFLKAARWEECELVEGDCACYDPFLYPKQSESFTSDCAGFDIRLIRVLLWNLVLSQPAVQAISSNYPIPSGCKNDNSSESCISPQSVSRPLHGEATSSDVTVDANQIKDDVDPKFHITNLDWGYLRKYENEVLRFKQGIGAKYTNKKKTSLENSIEEHDLFFPNIDEETNRKGSKNGLPKRGAQIMPVRGVAHRGCLTNAVKRKRSAGLIDPGDG